jgi:hypothetical protein
MLPLPPNRNTKSNFGGPAAVGGLSVRAHVAVREAAYGP